MTHKDVALVVPPGMLGRTDFQDWLRNLQFANWRDEKARGIMPTMARPIPGLTVMSYGQALTGHRYSSMLITTAPYYEDRRAVDWIEERAATTLPNGVRPVFADYWRRW